MSKKELQMMNYILKQIEITTHLLSKKNIKTATNQLKPKTKQKI